MGTRTPSPGSWGSAIRHVVLPSDAMADLVHPWLLVDRQIKKDDLSFDMFTKLISFDMQIMLRRFKSLNYKIKYTEWNSILPYFTLISCDSGVEYVRNWKLEVCR